MRAEQESGETIYITSGNQFTLVSGIVTVQKYEGALKMLCPLYQMMYEGKAKLKMQ